jgi:sec-independent protein translocase protein TatC
VPLIFSSVFFMVVGIGFAYLFVLPAAYKFFISFAARTGAETMQDLQKYWDFTLSIFFGFGITFEVPVVEMLLVKLGMVTTQQLRDARRYVVVGAFVVAAVLTPPDVLSQFMLAVPLVLLYELGIFLAGFVTARSRSPEAAADAAADAAAGATPATGVTPTADAPAADAPVTTGAATAGSPAPDTPSSSPFATATAAAAKAGNVSDAVLSNDTPAPPADEPPAQPAKP